MTRYLYRCPAHGLVEVEHPMSEVYQPHTCPRCGRTLRRKPTPIHHWWPSNDLPGNEESGQRLFLDADFQARERDRMAEMKEEHLNREARA